MAYGLLNYPPPAQRPNPRIAALLASPAPNALAAAGRGGDTELGHLTRGEVVVPLGMQTPRLMRALLGAAEETGHDLNRYTVGGQDDSHNPKTGLPEYGYGSDTDGGADQGVGGSDSAGGRGAGVGGEPGYDGYAGAILADALNTPAPPGPQGGGGQIADFNRQDLIGLGYNPDDYSQRPDLGQRIGYFLDTIPDRISHGIRDMVNNPGRTLTNLAFNAIAPGVPSLINTGVGLLDPDFSVGGLATRGVRAMTDYTPTPASYTEPDKNTDNGKPNARDDGGYPGSYGGGDNGPQGSKDSPLAKGGFQQQTPSSVAQSALGDALLGRPSGLNSWDGNAFTVGTDAGHPNTYNGWNGNKFVIGGRQWSPTPQYSYSPTGTPYVTHWAPNGLLGGA